MGYQYQAIILNKTWAEQCHRGDYTTTLRSAFWIWTANGNFDVVGEIHAEAKVDRRHDLLGRIYYSWKNISDFEYDYRKFNFTVYDAEYKAHNTSKHGDSYYVLGTGTWKTSRTIKHEYSMKWYAPENSRC